MPDYSKIPELHKVDSIFGLTGKAAVIFGGAGKMGQQFAITLGYAGAKVVLSDVDAKKCKAVAKEVAALTSTSIIGLKCDASKEGQVQELFKKVHDTYEKIDILIYNVMAKPEGYYKPLNQYPVTTWKGVLNGNLTGAFLCCREAVKYMEKSQGGSIVLTSSVYGIVGPDQRIYKDCSPKKNIYGGADPLNCPASYSASKAGLIGLARHLAAQWGEFNIRVNVLMAGGVYDSQEESFHNEYVKRTPLGRMAVWSDYNGAVLFLASDASRYMTGATLVIDGGWTSW